MAEKLERLTNTVTVGNKGKVPAHNVLVKDTLSHIEEYLTNPSEVILTRGVNTKTYLLEDLQNGITLVLDSKENMTLSFAVKVKDYLEDGQKLLNIVYADEEVDEVEITYHETQLKVIESSQDEIVPGEDLTYGITIENVGEIEFKEIFVTDTLEGLLSYLVNPEKATIYVNDEAVRSVQDLMERMILNGLKPNQKHVHRFTVKTDHKLLKDVKALTNTVKVNNDTSTVEVPVVYPKEHTELPTTGTLGIGIFAWSLIYAGLALLLKRRSDC